MSLQIGLYMLAVGTCLGLLGVYDILKNRAATGPAAAGLQGAGERLAPLPQAPRAAAPATVPRQAPHDAFDADNEDSSPTQPVPFASDAPDDDDWEDAPTVAFGDHLRNDPEYAELFEKLD